MLGKQERRQRLQQALKVLQAHEEAIAAGTLRKPKPNRTRKKQAREAKPVSEEHQPMVSPTDPEATVQKGRHGLLVGYNGQAVVDSQSQIVVAGDVVRAAHDSSQLLPMLAEAQAMTGRLAEALVADRGYFVIDDISQAEDQGISLYVSDPRDSRADGPAHNPYHKEHFVYDPVNDSYTCPAGQPLRHKGQTHWDGKLVQIYTAADCSQCPACQSKACTKAKKRSLAVFGHEAQLKAFAAKMCTERAQQVLRQRKAVVEPVFAVFREHLGLLRFLLRGLENVRAEWRLLCVAHNLRKLWRFWWRPKVLSSAVAT